MTEQPARRPPLDPPRHRVPARELGHRGEASGEVSISLAELWSWLAAGKVRIVDSDATQQDFYLTVEHARHPAHELPRRDVSVLQRLLLGQSQKAVALDLGVSTATVALAAAQSLRAMGVETANVSKAPAALVLAACASTASYGRQLDLFPDHRHLTRIRVSRPQAALAGTLTRSEFAVAWAMLEGRSTAQIARARGVSTRTISDQLSTVFSKVGVSGRLQLLSALARESVTEAVTTRTIATEASPDDDADRMLWAAARDMWRSATSALTRADAQAQALRVALEG